MTATMDPKQPTPDSKPTSLVEVDLLRLQLLFANKERLEAQYQAALLQHQAQQSELFEHLKSTYQLDGDDQIDSTTGAIMRKIKE